MNIKNKVRSAKCGVLGALVAVGLSAFADPSVTVDKVESVEPWDSTKGKITVNYTLGGVDAKLDYKVAFDVKAGGKTASVTNAAAKLTNGAATKEIDTATLFGKEVVDTKAKVKVSLIAVKPKATVPTDEDGFDTTAENVSPYYSTTFIPGDYCVVDLTSGQVTEMKNVTDAATFNTTDYKTTKMAFRYVPAGKFKANCAKISSVSTLVANDVTLSAYWIAVFPVTEAQFNAVKGGETTSAKPKTSISWNNFRGGTWTGWDGTYANVPAPGSGTFVKALNDKVAGAGCADKFDLCTSFQWERAARAGTRTDYFFSDVPVASVGTTDYKALYDYAWFTKNSDDATHDVGGKSPNAWGLYDVYGNTYDWCLDYQATLEGVTPGTDYAGPASGEGTRVCRGDSCKSDAQNCSSVRRYYSGQASTGTTYGFRLIRKAAAK